MKIVLSTLWRCRGSCHMVLQYLFLYQILVLNIMFVYFCPVHLETCDLFVAAFLLIFQWFASRTPWPTHQPFMYLAALDLVYGWAPDVTAPCPHWKQPSHQHAYAAQSMSHVYNYDYDVWCFMLHQDDSRYTTYDVQRIFDDRCIWIFTVIDYSIIIYVQNESSILVWIGLSWIFCSNNHAGIQLNLQGLKRVSQVG